MNPIVVNHKDYTFLDGLEIDGYELTMVGSELAKKLVGRDFSAIYISAKLKSLIKMTIEIYVEEPDIETIAKMFEATYPENKELKAQFKAITKESTQ
jgi:hypothetical protein